MFAVELVFESRVVMSHLWCDFFATHGPKGYVGGGVFGLYARSCAP